MRRDNRISIFTMDPATGKVTWRQPVPVEGGPDPLAFDPRHRFLYVACRDRRQLSSYRIDPATGSLSLISTVPIEGEPIQIVIDRTGRFLLSVHFYQSTVGVHAISDQGVIAPTPVEWRVTSYGCHGIEVDPSNRYVFVPHVTRSGGPNAVAQFRFDEKTGHLAWNAPAFLTLTEHEGPRHLLVHPTLNMAYSADEQGASATAYRLDPIERPADEGAEHLHGAERLHGEGPGYLFGAADPPQRAIAVRRHPRARQHCQLCHRPDDGQAVRG